MKLNSYRRDLRRGSALLAALIVIVILSFAAAGVLSYSLTTYRNSMRQALLDQAKEVADSEMEYLYYQWKVALLNKAPVANVSCLMTSGNPNPGNAQAVPNPNSPLVSPQSYPTIYPSSPPQICGTDMSTTAQLPFSSADSTWVIHRCLVFNPIQGTSDGSAQGFVPGTLQVGHNFYFSAYVSASIENPVVGTISYHSGRHFVYSSTSLFQFALFYQGNLEIAAGGNMTITGPISTNASTYMGSQSGYTLTISSNAYYFQDYNGASDPLSGETKRLEGSGNLGDPIYNPNPEAAAPGNQAAQRAIQVVKLASQSSFIGGVDVANDIATYPTAYSNVEGVPDPNEVYRAVIAPPPTVGNIPGGTLIPEDPVVASSRMYNTASLLITVQQTGPTGTGIVVYPASGWNTKINVGTAANPTAYNTAFANSLTAGASPIITSVRTNIEDPREYLNGATSGVNLTTVDIGALNTALTAPGTGILATNPTLAAAYNGVVYVYDSTDGSPTSSIAPNSLNGIRLVNATTTPNVSDQNNNPLGFSVVSNNGVYVQGDYNTTKITAGGEQVNNPAAIMGDAITALSQSWNPAESTAVLSGRQATASTNVAANGVNPAATPATPGGMTVNAAILTGNTPSTATTNSGGAQNLVRMMEDWWDGPAPTLTLDGSLGQLFTSKYFSGPYTSTATQPNLPNVNDRVYYQPPVRNFNYDNGFLSRTPAGSPTTTNFARGDFFFW